MVCFYKVQMIRNALWNAYKMYTTYHDEKNNFFTQNNSFSIILLYICLIYTWCLVVTSPATLSGCLSLCTIYLLLCSFYQQIRANDTINWYYDIYEKEEHISTHSFKPKNSWSTCWRYRRTIPLHWMWFRTMYNDSGTWDDTIWFFIQL